MRIFLRRPQRRENAEPAAGALLGGEFTIPSIAGLTTTYFTRLQLKDQFGHFVSDNIYWYSTTPDKLGKKSTWYNTAIGTDSSRWNGT